MGTGKECQAALSVLQQPCEVLSRTLILNLREWKHRENNLPKVIPGTHTQARLPGRASNLSTHSVPLLPPAPKAAPEKVQAPGEVGTLSLRLQTRGFRWVLSPFPPHRRAALQLDEIETQRGPNKVFL